MAGGWNSGSDRDAMLRRVAIVLSSLPAPMATKLLGTMGPDSKQAVRRTMSTLTDVDPLERQRAIQAFKVMFQRQPRSVAVEASQGDSLQLQTSTPTSSVVSNARVVTTTDGGSSQSKTGPRSQLGVKNDSPLAFLGEVDDVTLSRLLTAEHPQTIAFVLASISPEQAARVLPQLGAKRQQETMSRIGRLGEIPDTAVAEVAEHFRSRLQEHASSNRHSLGRQALEAIMAAMPKQTPMRAADELEQQRSAVHATQAESGSQHYPTAEMPVLDLTQRLRVAEQTWPDQMERSERSHQAETRSADLESAALHDSLGQDERRAAVAIGKHEVKSGAMRSASQPFDSTDGIHQHLVNLSPTELCQALGRVDTRDAMLTLCGLPVHVADAALAVLPRAQAKTVRTKMNSLGSLHLREIDRAKEKVAEASLETFSSASLQTPLAA